MPFGLSWTEVVFFVVFIGGGFVAFAALVAWFLSRFLRKPQQSDASRRA